MADNDRNGYDYTEKKTTWDGERGKTKEKLNEILWRRSTEYQREKQIWKVHAYIKRERNLQKIQKIDKNRKNRKLSKEQEEIIREAHR